MSISLQALTNENDKIEIHSLFIKRSFEALTEDLLFLFERLNIRVSLAAVFMEGHNPTISRDLLRKTCDSLPIHFSEYLLPENTGLEEVAALVKSLNRVNNGLIIDLPFLPDFMLKQLFNLIDPLKNVRLNNSDYLKLKQLDHAPYDEYVLGILMILEKTFHATVEQISKRRGNT